MLNTWVYDLEVFRNAFVAVFKNVDTEEERIFASFYYEDDTPLVQDNMMELVYFLMERPNLIGYNNISYDDTIIEHFMRDKLFQLPIQKTLYSLKQLSDILINEDYQDPNKYNRILATLDLYLIWHFNNKHKALSLKALQAAIGYPNVQDMPIHHDSLITSYKQLDELIGYCRNDVDSTYELYKLSKDKIKLRIELSKEYGIDFMNKSDSSIGELIFLHYLSRAKGTSTYEIRKQTQQYPGFWGKEVILPYVSFDTKELQQAHRRFEDTYISTDENEKADAKSFSAVLEYLTFDFGLGGLHATKKSGDKTIPEIYKAGEGEQILLVDVSSYYPNLSIKNKFFPRHLGKEFCEVYEDLYNKRKEAKYSGDKITDSSLKLSLNSVYGKSKSKYSFLYDPKFTMSITINGQLLLAMLCEKFILNNIHIIQANTDGITVKIKDDQRQKLEELCNEWMELTSLDLDYDEFDLIVQRDVNNYLGRMTNGYIKLKGCFEIDKDYHKNNSQRIVAIALKEYFVNNVPIETTIKDHESLLDYTLVARAKGQSHIVYHYVKDGEHVKKDMQKTMRYIISPNGGTLIKHYSNGKTENLTVGYKHLPLNVLCDKSDVELDYSYYIRECNKILNLFNSNQLDLFYE